MKKYTLDVLILIVLVGIFNPMTRVLADSPSDPGTCTYVNDNGSKTVDSNSTRAECATTSDAVFAPAGIVVSPTTNASGVITPSAALPGGLVPCDNTPDSKGKIANPCNFNALMALVNKVINFILYSLVIPIAAIMFAYAGFLMVTAGEEIASARTKAKSIFTNVALGLILVAASWLIIKMILSILGYNGAWIGFSPF